ncbi:TPA: hypothetical protein ACUZAU_004715, partial [Salmonella enterica]
PSSTSRFTLCRVTLLPKRLITLFSLILAMSFNSLIINALAANAGGSHAPAAASLPWEGEGVSHRFTLWLWEDYISQV